MFARLTLLFLVAICVMTSALHAQEAVELRFACVEERDECAVYADLLSRFSVENPAIQVAVDVMSPDEMALAGDEAPDIARLVDLERIAGQGLDLRPLLADADALDSSFNSLYFEALRGESDSGIYGYPDALGMVAPFVNISAFEAANVALPGEDATWEDWLAALDMVADATGIPYALAVDNKDHRFAGAAMSLGADYFDDAGGLSLPDDSGLRAFVEMLADLRDRGRTPTDTLLGTGKSESYFVRGDALMYICGSWKAESVAMQVGSDFDWAIVPGPRGSGGSSAIAKATFLVALANTDHPEAVAQVFDYLTQPEIIAEFSARTLTVPAHIQVAASAIAYESGDPVVSAALSAFANEVASMQDQAIALDLHPMAHEYYAASNAFLRGYFAGDWTLDEALSGMGARLLEAAG